MNNFSFPLENNLNYEDEKLNKKINEYNQIYNNNNNKYKLNDAIIKSDIKINENSKNIKENNYNRILKENKYINNSNKKSTNNYIPPELINLSEIENEYDIYISNLKVQLSKERAERKKKEEEAILIQHRLTLLKNQEQSKLLQIKKIKEHIDKIINNRIESQEKLNEKLNEKKNSNIRNATNKSWIIGNNSYSQMKKNISCSNFSHKSNNSKNLKSNSQSNFYNSKFKIYDFDKNNENNKGSYKKIKSKEKNFEKNTLDNSDIKKRMNNFNNINIRLNSDENKKLFKQQLIEKIKQDEEEKRKIEEEISKIEEEEKMLLNQLDNRWLENNNNFEG